MSLQEANYAMNKHYLLTKVRKYKLDVCEWQCALIYRTLLPNETQIIPQHSLILRNHLEQGIKMLDLYFSIVFRHLNTSWLKVFDHLFKFSTVKAVKEHCTASSLTNSLNQRVLKFFVNFTDNCTRPIMYNFIDRIWEIREDWPFYSPT